MRRPPPLVLEPADTWLRYLEPMYRDRAIRIDRDAEGYEVLVIDGMPLKTLRGQLGALGGIDMDASRLLTRGQVYPHIHASFGAVRELRERLAPVSAEARAKVLGNNALRFYRPAA